MKIYLIRIIIIVIKDTERETDRKKDLQQKKQTYRQKMQTTDRKDRECTERSENLCLLILICKNHKIKMDDIF